MTGFGSISHEDNVAAVSVTARSVNHRYLDIQFRLSSHIAGIESQLRELVQQKVARGRVELGVNLQTKITPSVELDLNEPFVEEISKATEMLLARGWIGEGLSAGELLRFPNVINVREQPHNKKSWQSVRDTVIKITSQALEDLDSMRQKEGEFLQADLIARSIELTRFVEAISVETKAGERSLRKRLLARIEELGLSVQIDTVVIEQEVVRWVARSDIHEEVARLSGHLEHLNGLVAGSSPCGRKLDFLVQEMNREVNTIGSKAEGRNAGQLVVAAKAELEKLREQLQNVE
jgi:uncharacterized protein (TIGR00255 family)